MFILNVGLESDKILIAISVVLWLLCLAVAAIKIRFPYAYKYFVLALIFLPAYMNWKLFLVSNDFFTPFGVFDMWFRHLFFYAGQVFFFIFIMKIFLAHTAGRSEEKKTVAFSNFLFVIFISILILPRAVYAIHTIKILELPLTPYNILLFLTDQGVQHILAIIFFFLTIAIIRTQALYTGLAELKKMTVWFFVANGFFIMLHIWEYATENLHLLSMVDEEFIENFEFLFQYLGLIFFFFSAFKLKKFEIAAGAERAEKN